MALPDASLVLDAQGAQNRESFDRGIPRYIGEHLRAVLDLAPAAVRSVALNPARPLTGNLMWLLGSGRLSWSQPPSGADERPPLYHVMSPFELDRPLAEVWPSWVRSGDVRTVVTLYDLIPLVFEDHYLRDPVWRSHYIARAGLVRSADRVLTISQATAGDAVERLGVDAGRITVIDAGVSTVFAGMYDDDAAAWRMLRQRLDAVQPDFMLYVSGIEFRKNNERLIEAYGHLPAAVRAQHQLVIACRMRPEDRAALEQHARAHGVEPGRLLMPGFVSDAELAALYRLCRLFVFASFYEGSGLPILEAMACGAPVVASGTSTTPEILGDTEATFDPFDPADIAECLARTVRDDAVLRRLRERSERRVREYTWRRVGERTLAGYEAALNRVDARRRRRRARVAWVSPWPPEQSGIANYNVKLVAQLARHIDVDVFVADSPARYARPHERGVRLLGADDFEWASELRNYDAFVYSMGNSSFHGHVYEMLKQRPGVVVAHDVRLVGFFGWYAGREQPEDPSAWLAQRLHDAYAPRIDAGPFVGRPPTAEEQTALGLFLTGDIQHHAEQLIVHSSFAADVLRLDRPPERRDPPRIAVLPLAIEPLDGGGRMNRSARDPLIVSFGIVSEVKGIATLLESFALLAATRPSARLVLAGPADPPELERWRRYAIDLGVDDRVEIPGFVPREDYERLLRTATLAVQLRTVTNGEASAAVGDCLGAGLPTVATDLGWASELPDRVFERVPLGVTPAALATTIERVLDDPDARVRLAEAARAYATENTFDRVARRYLEVLAL